MTQPENDVFGELTGSYNVSGEQSELTPESAKQIAHMLRLLGFKAIGGVLPLGTNNESDRVAVRRRELKILMANAKGARVGPYVSEATEDQPATYYPHGAMLYMMETEAP